MFRDELKELSREAPALNRGKLPPLISFVIAIGVILVALFVSIFYIFPFFINIIGFDLGPAIIVSIVGFFILLFILSAIVGLFIETRYYSKRGGKS